MGRRALSEEEKLQKAKEKEMQKELQEKQYFDFANARLCDLVKESTLKKFYNKINDCEDLSEAQIIEMIIEAFNKGVIELQVETKKEYFIGIK